MACEAWYGWWRPQLLHASSIRVGRGGHNRAFILICRGGTVNWKAKLQLEPTLFSKTLICACLDRACRFGVQPRNLKNWIF